MYKSTKLLVRSLIEGGFVKIFLIKSLVWKSCHVLHEGRVVSALGLRDALGLLPVISRDWLQYVEQEARQCDTLPQVQKMCRLDLNNLRLKLVTDIT